MPARTATLKKTVNGKGGKGDKDDKSDKSDKPAATEVKVTIDFNNIGNRIEALPPMPAGNYRIIGTTEEGGLLYSSGNKIMRYNIKEQK